MPAAATPQRPTAFVTGASQGIGAGIAVEMAGKGYDVAVSSTRPEKLSPVLDAIRAAGARALPVELDIREQASIERAMAAVLGEFGSLDVLVNNAAVVSRTPALDLTREEWNNLVNTNLTGTFFMTQQMGRHLIGTKRAGAIISITSTHGVVGLANRSAYGISKAAVMHMSRMLAIEWAEYGIRVNTVAPGAVITPSRAEMSTDPDHAKRRMARIPMQKLCSVEEIAAAVSYLASPQASYITGQTLVLDGGVTSQ
jgi:NAD(P)-dependent dehydrogenase (short-subunit alcohol dehydrogenase family)